MSAAAAPLDDRREVPTQALIEHIKTRYHAVHLAELPKLRDLAAKVETTHHKHPAVPAGLTEILARLIAELRLHQQREEVVLFPLLAQGGGEMAHAAIRVMRAEHKYHGTILAGIETKTGGRVAPQGTCATWRATVSRPRQVSRGPDDAWLSGEKRSLPAFRGHGGGREWQSDIRMQSLTTGLTLPFES